MRQHALPLMVLPLMLRNRVSRDIVRIEFALKASLLSWSKAGLFLIWH